MRRAPAAAVLLLAALAGRPAGAQPGVPPPEVFDTADGVRLQGLLHRSPKGALRNDAVVVLLYPPGPEKSMMKGNWEPLIEALTADGFHVFRFDWRGHGASTEIVDPLGNGVDPDAGFFTNRITGSWNQRSVKGGMNLKKAPTEIRVKGGVTLPLYLPVFVNDLAAARLHLDRLNDRGLVNTSSIYLVGAGDAATLGFLWLAAEWARPADLNALQPGQVFRAVPRDSRAVLFGRPAGEDVGGAVWLSASRPTVVPQNTLRRWAVGKPRLRSENPMLFLYGGNDVAARAAAGAFADGVLFAQGNKELNLPPVPATGTFDLAQTKLSGVDLLGAKGVPTEASVLEYLRARHLGRAAAVWRQRNYLLPYHIDPAAFALGPP